jgi:opacity protein-like surface antigen
MRLLRVSVVVIALLVCLAPAKPARSGDDGKYAGSIAVAAVGALVCTAVAVGLDHPDGTDEYERKGWFVSLAGSYAIPTNETDLEDDASSALGTPVGVSVDNSLGVGGDIGYRCHRYFSTAVEVEQVMGFKTELSIPGAGSFAVDDIDPLVVTTNFKAHLPLGRFQPFALAGGGMMAASIRVRDTSELGLSFTDNAKDIVLRFGAGLDFYATKHIVLNVGVDYLIPLKDLDGLNYISVGWGVQYRF